MSTEHLSQIALTPDQEEALIELGERGSAGIFDPIAMSQLLDLGLAQVRSEDRKVRLTARGISTYLSLIEAPE